MGSRLPALVIKRPSRGADVRIAVRAAPFIRIVFGLLAACQAPNPAWKVRADSAIPSPSPSDGPPIPNDVPPLSRDGPPPSSDAAVASNDIAASSDTALPLIGSLMPRDPTTATEWVVRTNLQVGDQVYTDRDYTLRELPAAFAGADWIQPANVARDFQGTPLVTFTLGRDATVHVFVDQRFFPVWLDSSWSRSDPPVARINDVGFITDCAIFSRRYVAGTTVSLGNYYNVTNMMRSMYFVVVQ
jgi:hypothetical protein